MKLNILIILTLLLFVPLVSAETEWAHLRFSGVTDVEGLGGNKVRITILAVGESPGNVALSIGGPGIFSYEFEQSASVDVVKDECYKFTAIVTLRNTPVTSEYTNYVYARPVIRGKETEAKFKSINMKSDGVKTYQVGILLKCHDADGMVNAPIYVDYKHVGYGNVVVALKEGTHYIYSDNVSGWYSDFIVTAPLKITIDKDQKIITEFNTEPLLRSSEKQVVQEDLSTAENPKSMMYIGMTVVIFIFIILIVLVVGGIYLYKSFFNYAKEEVI